MPSVYAALEELDLFCVVIMVVARKGLPKA